MKKKKARLPQFYLLLKALTQIKNQEAQQFLLRRLSRDKEFRLCIKEIATNIANQSVKLSKRDKRRLNRQSTLIQDLAKEKRVSQAGGFLNIAVPLLATVVGELIASAVTRKK